MCVFGFYSRPRKLIFQQYNTNNTILQWPYYNGQRRTEDARSAGTTSIDKVVCSLMSVSISVPKAIDIYIFVRCYASIVLRTLIILSYRIISELFPVKYIFFANNVQG